MEMFALAHKVTDQLMGFTVTSNEGLSFVIQLLTR